MSSSDYTPRLHVPAVAAPQAPLAAASAPAPARVGEDGSAAAAELLRALRPRPDALGPEELAAYAEALFDLVAPGAVAFLRLAVVRALTSGAGLAGPDASGGSGAVPAVAGAAVPPLRPATAVEAAEWLSVSVPTINKWCLEGRFPNAWSLAKAGWRIPWPDVAAVRLEAPNRGRPRPGPPKRTPRPRAR